MLKELFRERLITMRVVRNDRQVSSEDDHESEVGTSGLDVDIEIRNDGTLEELHSAIQPVLIEMIRRN
jgi:hypothetical protein